MLYEVFLYLGLILVIVGVYAVVFDGVDLDGGDTSDK